MLPLLAPAQRFHEATGEQEDAYRQLAAADEEAAQAIAQRTARLRGLQQALVQVRQRPARPRSANCHPSACSLIPMPASRSRLLPQWRGRIVANSNEWQRRNGALAREKEIVLGHHTALKSALARSRDEQQARLKKMCVS
jgi:hypothetical protein